jgi:F0F1-type ATP synthase assembly protein I
MDWASRVTTLGLEFALPPLLGAFLDRRWGSSPAGVLVGAVLGFVVGMMHLLKLAREGTAGKQG